MSNNLQKQHHSLFKSKEWFEMAFQTMFLKKLKNSFYLKLIFYVLKLF
jgi:hypothetical protein